MFFVCFFLCVRDAFLFHSVSKLHSTFSVWIRNHCEIVAVITCTYIFGLSDSYCVHFPDIVIYANTCEEYVIASVTHDMTR